jgi:hypothetical protein
MNSVSYRFLQRFGRPYKFRKVDLRIAKDVMESKKSGGTRLVNSWVRASSQLQVF